MGIPSAVGGDYVGIPSAVGPVPPRALFLQSPFGSPRAPERRHRPAGSGGAQLRCTVLTPWKPPSEGALSFV
ncbi:MAG: hypothetical protein ACM3XM_02890, partial [Mycobacterium leprae]